MFRKIRSRFSCFVFQMWWGGGGCCVILSHLLPFASICPVPYGSFCLLFPIYVTERPDMFSRMLKRSELDLNRGRDSFRLISTSSRLASEFFSRSGCSFLFWVFWVSCWGWTMKNTKRTKHVLSRSIWWSSHVSFHFGSILVQFLHFFHGLRHILSLNTNSHDFNLILTGRRLTWRRSWPYKSSSRRFVPKISIIFPRSCSCGKWTSEQVNRNMLWRSTAPKSQWLPSCWRTDSQLLKPFHNLFSVLICRAEAISLALYDNPKVNSKFGTWTQHKPDETRDVKKQMLKTQWKHLKKC